MVQQMKISDGVTATDLAWLAGLLDGDGHIGARLDIHGNGHGRPVIRTTIQIAMTHEPTIDHTCSLFGGSKFHRTYQDNLPVKRNHRDVWEWRAGQLQHQYDVLTGVYPYLITKQECAKLVLAIVENKLSESPDLMYQMELAIQLKGLK